MDTGEGWQASLKQTEKDADIQHYIFGNVFQFKSSFYKHINLLPVDTTITLPYVDLVF